MLLPPEVRIRTATELTAVWRFLRGDLRSADLALWVLLIDAGGAPGPLLTLAGLPDGPYDVREDDLAGLVEDVAASPDGSLALLYCRPGAGPWHTGDRSWARFLSRLDLPAPRWPLHRAHDRALEIVVDPVRAGQNRRYG